MVLIPFSFSSDMQPTAHRATCEIELDGYTPVFSNLQCFVTLYATAVLPPSGIRFEPFAAEMPVDQLSTVRLRALFAGLILAILIAALDSTIVATALV